MDDPARPAQAAPQWLLDVIEESEADLAAGRTSPWPEVRARLMQIIEDQDAAKVQRQA